jgi:hypothetical protein
LLVLLKRGCPTGAVQRRGAAPPTEIGEDNGNCLEPLLIFGIDTREQNKNNDLSHINQEAEMVVRLARETLALASVAGFVWMVCSVAHLVA